MDFLSFIDLSTSFVLVLLASFLFYLYGIWPYGVWKSLGVDGPKPSPFIGNYYQMVTEGAEQFVQKWSKKYGRTFGMYSGRVPLLVTTDLDILKQVLVKDFNKFTNRFEKMEIAPQEIRSMLPFTAGAQWKRIRHILTPTFSTGKLKQMEHYIQRCCIQLTNNIEETIRRGEKIDVKRVYGGYAMDVIAGTAFGVEVNSQKDLDHPFVRDAGTFLTDILYIGSYLLLLSKAVPVLVPFINFLVKHFFQPRGYKSFIRNVQRIKEERQLEENRNKKPDFLQLMMSCEENQSPNKDRMNVLSSVEVIAQASVFFFAGYESTASTLQFMAYLLALHPEVQEKIVREIKEQLGDEIPDHDGILKLKYLDSVIHETLRMYPSFYFTDRIASEEVTIKGVTIPKGAGVIIPIANVMRDPEYFPDPDNFIPERFYEGSVDPISFLAFGYGPRLCLGMRLSLLEVKMAMVHVLRRVKFLKTDDLQESLKMKPGYVLTIPDRVIAIKAVMRDVAATG
ncbi:cytochrome P450 3A24-like [Pomacea canaliculata]|uniref:cytochrome P450 3A24-like n=1 Tax=Pomacea canaliculata TaxID=400727 RepID=UPI000D7258D7|nr:cytochrome P450 3A24-like [Pomacea canaliculata]